jgi:hypothetical protein
VHLVRLRRAPQHCTGLRSQKQPRTRLLETLQHFLVRMSEPVQKAGAQRNDARSGSGDEVGRR